MNTNLFLRYVIELSIFIPASIIAIIPVYYYKKVKAGFLFGTLAALLITIISGGAFLCTLFGQNSNTVTFISMVVMFGAYHYFFNLSLSKKLFCFANAVMLCGFATTYTRFLTAPLELENNYLVYEASSGLIRVCSAVVIGAIFTHTLYVEFPALLDTETLDPAWKVLMIAPMTTAAAVIWMKPINAANAMTGRLRMICLVVLWAIPLIALFLYHVFWWFSKKMTETAQLQQSYDILKMEEKQYRITQRYLQETSQLRHDFRHHLHVILEYAENGQKEDLLAYTKPLAEIVDKPVKSICKNIPLNAICSHYYYKAHEYGIRILWGIDLEEQIPINETELCSVIGNLLDNSIHAVCKLKEEERLIDLRIGMVSSEALAISIKNRYEGIIIMDKNNLPVTDKINHGIGLRSVSNTVERYSGSMVIQTKDGVFDVSIVMYSPD